MAATGGSTYTYTGAQTQFSPHWANYPAGCGASAAGDQLNIISAFTECIVSRTQDLPSPNDSFWLTAQVTADAAGMGDTGVVDSGVGLGVSDGDKYMRAHLIKDNGEAKVALVTGGVPDASLSIAADWISGPVIVTLYRYGTTVGIEVGMKQITESYSVMDDDDPVWMPRVIFGHIVSTTRVSTWHTLEWSIGSEELEVAIDIRPRSKRNVISLRQRGMIPVAILSAEDFDAPNDLDRPSLTFGRTGNETSLAHCRRWGHRDVNHDGLKDQVCYFWTRKTEFEIGDTEGVLRGLTKDGVQIEGRDHVTIKRW